MRAGRRRGVPTGLVAAIAAVALSGCADAPPQARGAAPDGAPSVTFVGDSWTVGLGATDSGGYTVLTAERLGWQHTDLGVNGSGYVEPGGAGPFADRIDAAVSGRPDVIVVQGSLNDSLADVADVAEAARRTLARLSDAADPDTRVLVVGAPYCPGVDGDVIDAINGGVAEAADAAGLPFVDPAGENWVDPADPDLWADPYHPDDDGYRRMAERLAPLLRDMVDR
jgi:lysophospholipase L1-like esterase